MWWLPLVTGILMIIMAFMLAFNPVLSILTIGMWAGLAVIMKGIELIILAITMSKAKAAITQTEKRVDEAVEGYVKAAEESREELAKAAEAYVKAAEDAGKDKN